MKINRDDFIELEIAFSTTPPDNDVDYENLGIPVQQGEPEWDKTWVRKDHIYWVNSSSYDGCSTVRIKGDAVSAMVRESKESLMRRLWEY